MTIVIDTLIVVATLAGLCLVWAIIALGVSVLTARSAPRVWQPGELRMWRER